MKHCVLISVLTLLLVACSKQEPATSTPAEEPAIEAEVAETPTTNEAVTTTETLEVVEESAAEAPVEDEAIVLARADDIETTRTWQFREGQHFTRMTPTQPTVGGADRIEVAEVFMYSCSHCYDLEAFMEHWAENKDPSIRFVRIPAIFNNLAQIHAQLYYTEEVLAENGLLADQKAFRNMVFEEFHRRGNRIASVDAVQSLFGRAGVGEEDFLRTWKSFEVNQKMRVAADLARRYNIQSVPMIIVNGKYRTDAGSAGSYPKLLEVIDELTVREGLR